MVITKKLNIFLCGCALALVFASPILRAQDMDDTPEIAAADDLSLDALETMLPAHLRAPLPIKGQVPEPQKQTPDVPASAIESFYRDATGNLTLSQFGYDFFAGGDTASTDKATTGAVQDDYVLGAGDRITISFLGERRDRKTYSIDSSGSLQVDSLPPIAATGKTLGELRTDIRSMLDMQSFHGDVYISLENIRQLSVLVAGHVSKPGRQQLSALQTVLEALENAGGVLKTGSLRQIRLVRAGQTTPIDLYDVISNQDAPAALPNLRDGDRIIVPPLGATLALTGDVRQAGIYELPITGDISAQDAVTLAGGMLAGGQNRMTLETPQANGERRAQVITESSDTRVGDGAIISVVRTDDQQAASFTLNGETRSAGTFPLSAYPSLSKMLRTPQAYGDDVYPLMGVVSRRMKQDLARDLIAFNPQDIFMGRADMDLQDADIVTLLSRREVQDILNSKTPDTTLEPLLVSFIREHQVSLQGAVRLPGSWPVAGPVSVTKILDVAGGPLKDADLSRTEISRNDVGLPETTSGAVPHRDVVNLSDAGMDEVTITFGDAVRIPDRFEAVTRQSVTLLGEVRNPGTYDLMRGDTLLMLIDRAGGLTDQGYPLGTVFSRASERRREKEKFNAAARALEQSIAVSAQDKEQKIDPSQIAMAQDLINDIQTAEPVGRITVESDPAVLRRDPAQDILLEAGDKIFIPKRPLTVRVVGEVLSSAALQFRADKKSGDYLSEAGGLTQHADKGRMFVLNPDGSAQPLSAGSWTRFTPVMITPGSTIVVPRDPKPFDFMESAKDITQILSNLAISSIYAEDLVDRN